ncbi:hypothetical protein CQW23_12941 [Capsicum baccatum]|uniref:Uncharacterized protein n=1 Tax=Capsicum baccatum TaxID=33114 RepID=A0A2G2WU25_CAPBA|nr:hypothetical protein CQW23_12941 [Capsicum baccatum]
MELFYYVVFGAMATVVAVLELGGKTNKDRITTSQAFNSFKNNYILVYSLMMGTYVSPIISGSFYILKLWDCGVFVDGYVEYLSKGMDVHFVGFEAEYHQMRYTSLLQNYGIQNPKKDYVSENDDPPRPRTKIITLPDESGIVSIE